MTQSQATTSFSKRKLNMWKLVGNMSFDRREHTAIYIAMDDSVIIVGGSNYIENSVKRMEKFFLSCNCFKEFGRGLNVDGIVTGAVLLHNSNIAIASAPPPNIILLDPINGTVISSSPLLTAVNSSFIPTFLPLSGRILLTDRASVDDMNYTSQYQLYDPLSSTIRFVKGTISVRRINYAISYIDTVNKVLVTGGQEMRSIMKFAMNFANLYDVSTNKVLQLSFSPMNIPRIWHTSTFIPTINRVLLCGGCTNVTIIGGDCDLSTATCELFDPTTDTFFVLPHTMTVNRYRHSAVYLPWLNMVLIAGGERTQTGYYTFNHPFLQTTELFDPVSFNFVMAAEMLVPRALFTLTVVPSSDCVLACGGNYVKTQHIIFRTDLWWATSTCEMFIP